MFVHLLYCFTGLAHVVVCLIVFSSFSFSAALNKPLIDATNSNPEKLKSLATLSTIVAKEPAAASVKTEEELNPVIGEDAWNGEDETPEGRQRKQAQAIRNEIKGLKTLISQGEEIVKVLPVKTARLATLKKQLLKIDGEQIRAAAAEKLAKQQSLLKQVKSQENAIAEKLNHLKATHAKIKTNMDKVTNFLKSGAEAKKGKKEDNKSTQATPAAAAAPAKAAFLEQQTESEQESESESESETESEVEQESEVESETEQESESEAEVESETEAETEVEAGREVSNRC